MVHKSSVYDVTPRVTEQLPVWPGDPRPRQTWLSEQLSQWLLGSHTGAHVDAPRHLLADGSSLEAVAVATLLGPCRVVDLTAATADVGPGELEAALGAQRPERVLLKTRNSLVTGWDQQPFRPDFVGLTLDGARWLIQRETRLVGADYLSIESPESVERGAPVHRLLLGTRVTLVEGLDLTRVPAGSYVLVALPLRLDPSEGAPARVILLELGEPDAWRAR
jgi:arylformamidase